jgi:hypothetical protein
MYIGSGRKGGRGNRMKKENNKQIQELILKYKMKKEITCIRRAQKGRETENMKKNEVKRNDKRRKGKKCEF